MDFILCDELLQQIFVRVPLSSSTSVSLVCKRWLFLYRSSRSSLSLRLSPELSAVSDLTSLLSHYPCLSYLSLLLSSDQVENSMSGNLLALVSSTCCQLRSLRFLAGPVSIASLISLSRTCTYLASLCINLSRPIYLGWAVSFPCLKELSIILSSEEGPGREIEMNNELGLWKNEELDTELKLESLCLFGIRSDDLGLGWLWRSCTRLKKLQLRNCQGIGDGGSYSSFVNCLQVLEEIELRTSRCVIDMVLLKLTESCNSLSSLLVYDGGNRLVLLRFFIECTFHLQKLDLRLPLDIDNTHLFALASNQRHLSSLRLQSCCLVTGEGLNALGVAMSADLVELALINCDVVEREPGLLATLGQHLKQLRKLDLSYNELLVDKELSSMLVSCHCLVDLRLRGCTGLTNAVIFAMLKSCKKLQNVDFMQCDGIKAEAIETFVKNSPHLMRMEVEEKKLSDSAKRWAGEQFIEVIT